MVLLGFITDYNRQKGSSLKMNNGKKRKNYLSSIQAYVSNCERVNKQFGKVLNEKKST